jgi:hypothetical protein
MKTYLKYQLYIRGFLRIHDTSLLSVSIFAASSLFRLLHRGVHGGFGLCQRRAGLKA